MNHNPIADRISSFLKGFTPFSFFEPEVLQTITQASKVRHAQAEEVIFEEESKPQNCFFVVYKGSVKVELRKENRLIDWAEAGDCFGVRAMLSGQPYLLTAVCAEESLLLEIPIPLFKSYMEKNSQVLGFYAAGLASGTLLMRNQMAEVANASQDSFSALEINQKAPVSYFGKRRVLHSLDSHFARSGTPHGRKKYWFANYFRQRHTSRRHYYGQRFAKSHGFSRTPCPETCA